MRSCTAALLLITGAFAATQASAQLYRRPIAEHSYYPPGFQTPQVAPEIPFDIPDPNYFELPPGESAFGEVSGVGANPQGHVFVLGRTDPIVGIHGDSATRLFEYDGQGKFIRELGRGLYSFGYGHSVRIDKNGNIWVVDKGTDMVTELNYQTGKVMMVLGRREEATEPWWLHNPEDTTKAPPEEGGFAQPTDVAWDSKGNIYVSDGYIHSRVAKYDKDGNWIGTWGTRGVGPGQFWTVHDIAVDKYDHVWVADRSNGRLQVFDTNGNFLRQVIINVSTRPYQPLMGHEYPPGPDDISTPEHPKNMAYRPGAPDGICIPPDNPNVMYVEDLYPGRVYKINLDGKVLGYFGHVGKQPGETGALHGIACPSENLVYTAEFIDWRVQKWVLHPDRAHPPSRAPSVSRRPLPQDRR